jgi:hypothetical protein
MEGEKEEDAKKRKNNRKEMVGPSRRFSNFFSLPDSTVYP